MSLWLWITISAFFAAPPSVVEAATIEAPLSQAPTSQPSPLRHDSGPRSTEEAELLWTDGQGEFEAGRFSSAALHLQRLVQRYPAHRSISEANWLLGRALQASGDFKAAIEPLKRRVGSAGKGLPDFRARVELGRAYLGAGLAHEALLTALEAEKRLVPWLRRKPTPSPPPSARPSIRPSILPSPATVTAIDLSAGLATTPAPDIQVSVLSEPAPADSEPEALSPDAERGAQELLAEALLIKAQAQMSLNQDDRATRTLSAAQREFRGSTELMALAGWVELRLKTRACGRLLTRGPLDEGQARNQLERRSLCLNEALVIFREALPRSSDSWSELAHRTLSEAFQDYAHACKNPPLPPGKRSKAELKAYRDELLLALREDCRSGLERSAQLLATSDSTLSEAARAGLKKMLDEIARAKGSL